MAIYRPKAIGDAPEGLERSGGRCRRDFLASRGMGVSPGEESRVDSVAAQTIEAQPVFGQIEPSKRPRASRAEPQVREKMAILGLTWQEVETVRRRKRNEGRQKALSSVQSQLQTSGSSAVSVSTRTQSTPCSKEGRDYISLKLAGLRSARGCSRQARRADGAGSLLMCCGCENRLRIAPDCRVRIGRAGLGEDGQPRPCRAANKDRAEKGEDLTPD